MTSRHSEATNQLVLNHIRNSDAPLAARAISAQLSIGMPTVGNVLRELHKRGDVTRVLGSRGSGGGRPPYLYSAVMQPATVASAEPTPQTADAVTIKFRGKSAVRSAYITVTGSTYGKGARFTAAALTRHIAMRKYTTEAVYQAINRLEADGVISHVGQLKGASGRANKRYEVLVERDESVVPTKSRVRKAKVRSEQTVETVAVPVVAVDTLVARVAKLEATIAALAAALKA